MNKGARAGTTSTIAAGVLCAAAAIGALMVHNHLPLSEPDTSVRSLFSTAAAGDVMGFRQASTEEFYGSFVQYFGEAKYQRIQTVFRDVERRAAPAWLELRQRAQYAAALEYDALRDRVQRLGRDAFEKLSIDDRLRVNEQGLASFTFDAGLRALPDVERRLIADPEAFKLGGDRAQFAEANMWQYASADVKEALGSAAALSNERTMEKLAYLDRVGIPLLPKEWRAELGDIQRPELDDPRSFKFKYGEPLARAYLEQKRTPPLITVRTCTFEREEQRGGLLRGGTSSCVVAAPARNGTDPALLALDLTKRGNQWFVNGMSPALYQVEW